MVRPWKLPLKDKILILGQPGAYAKREAKNIEFIITDTHLVTPCTVQFIFSYCSASSFIFLK